MVLSCFDDSVKQSRDGIERRQDGAFLPRRNVGRMFARKHDPAVDLAQIVVMRGSGLVRPSTGTAEREWNAVPRHRDAVFEFCLVLRMNARAERDGLLDPV